MTFQSILFLRAEDHLPEETLEIPAFFSDLHIDQIVDAITVGRQEYDLSPLFSIPLHDLDAIRYRQEVMKDLEQPPLVTDLQEFAQQMRLMRRFLAQREKLFYPLQKERWFLDAVEVYGEAIQDLLRHLSQAELHSRGLLALRKYVAVYASSERFTALLAETHTLKDDLASVTYCVQIKGSSVKVRLYEGEADYSAEIEEMFAKFKQGAAKEYLVKLPDWPDMNHVEARILELVAQLYPEIFGHLRTYCTQHRAYLDATIATFDRELQFYLAYLEHTARFKRKGLPFCSPQLSDQRKEVSVTETFDLALAQTLLPANTPVVCNDVSLHGQERLLVVTGPNQGGKTTFARALGQIQYLASLGCPVPGREAQLFLCDQLFTHFEKEEEISDLRGKLEDELVRIHQILQRATSSSLIILNEIFTSTTINDASFLSKKILETIDQLDALCMCVTFIDELASFSEKTVSMVSTIVPEHPAMRTYRIVRQPADGLAYALAIAEKYRLTYARIKERISS